MAGRLAVVAAIAIAGLAAGRAPAVATGAVPGAGLQPLSPARLLDTRPAAQTIDNRYVGTGAVGPGGSIDVKVTGRGGVPEDGVGAVVLNVTAAAPTATTYVTVWPAGGGRPNASTLNAVAGQTVANSIVVGVGEGGQVSLYNDAGDTFLIVDVAGWFAAGSTFTPTTPARLLDTRPQAATVDGAYAGTNTVGPGGILDVQITGRGGVPADGAAAVAVNVTATAPTATSYVTAWPSGGDRPNASTLNTSAGATVANFAVIGLGDAGQVSLFNESGDVHLIIDVLGWFTEGGSYQPLVPARIADFRGGGTVDGLASDDAVLQPGESRPIRVAGRAGVPAAAVSAVVLNVTITSPTATSFITVWPGGTERPNASNLNVQPGQTVANAVVMQVGANGEINVFNESGHSRLIIDVVGWFGTVAQQQRTLDTGTGPFAHSCAIGRNAQVWCWGDNSSGQVGQAAGPSPAAPIVVAGTAGARGVATGHAHTCAVIGTAASCWGANAAGQLGDGTTVARPAAAPVAGLGVVVAVSAGATHTCALGAGGTVSCWGANGSGQLGNGTTTASSTPATVLGLTGVVAVSAGAEHTCAQRRDGTVSCWGANGSGQLGNGTTTASSTPVTVPGLTGVTAISAGNAHTCAALLDGSARCWGANGRGQLGNGTTTASSTPVVVAGLADVASIAAGPLRSCATTALGAAWCWGDNSGRALGNGSDAGASATPVPVYGLTNATGVAAGSTSTCAALADGTMRCWGLNINGQLGDGTVTPSGAPVLVSGP